MTTFVLIAIFLTGDSSHTYIKSVEFQEFSNRERCEIALDQIKSAASDKNEVFRYLSLKCVPK